MAPQREQNEIDIRELEFRQRTQTEILERLTNQVEANSKQSRENHESILVLEATSKTKSGIWLFVGGMMGTAAINLIVKLLTH